MKKVITIDFRPKTEAPTESGVHYARPIEGKTDLPRQGINPWLFTVVNNSVYGYACGPYQRDQFDWFGPVTEVQEASKGE